MDEYFIESYAWAMVNGRTGERELENIGPWYSHEDIKKTFICKIHSPGHECDNNPELRCSRTPCRLLTEGTK